MNLRIPSDQQRERLKFMTGIFKKAPDTSYADVAKQAVEAFPKWAKPDTTIISKAKRAAGIPSRKDKTNGVRKRAGMSHAVAEERMEFLMDHFTKTPNITNAAVTRLMKAKWPELPAPSSGTFTKARAESKKIRRSKPNHSIIEAELRHDTVLTVPADFEACMRQMQEKLEENEYGGIFIPRTGKAKVRIEKEFEI